ncbi:hypothetical protein GCM10023340_14540 [Nocardioides marinquilinus]|uniref:SAF domain-containing protein n=1 Tax=Nocardioides marinquilinus TaxID=1210400 RepID=A0ABP9PEL0_9ACTN
MPSPTRTPAPSPAAPTSRSRLARVRVAVRRAVLRRRRLLAAALTAVAAAAGLAAASEPPPATVPVTVAARDLPAGQVLGADDLEVVEFAPGSVPHGVADEPAGRVLAAPVARGEAVTDVRLVGPAMTTGRPDLVALPLRLPDAGAVALLRVGDRLDLVGADPQAGTASTVAAGVEVLALPADDGGTGPAGLPGRLVVLGVAPSEVTEIADATARRLVTYTWSEQ